MIRNFTICFMVLMLSSPIWPIGDQPMLGDPYIIVNKSSNQLAYITNGKIQEIYEVATGKAKNDTPNGEFTITVKAKHPYYRKKNIEGGDPHNPLGTRWMGFDALETDGRIYGIHGTNSPEQIGAYVTAGCVRLPNQSIEELYEQVKIGTKIFITDENRSFEDIASEKGVI
ncbi:L,D-transpeptidase [Alkalihalobacillus trypoxylicola]|uniref:L,D-transpeptidase n=1 Tax=Alkalihalobacillus trypoxylicola TaxID=519424 RepID=A0A162E9S7_9BACI|nr:L,D-transpeptidase [Alkalihalobacillus trypoxylicola]KYG32115.1 L,D-transpeptidase [Alkalihalobacillus trypoxylicola]